MVKVNLLKLDNNAQIILAIGILLIIIYVLFSTQGNLENVGQSLSKILSADQVKAAILAIVFVAVVGISIVYAKIDDPITLFAIAGGTTFVAFVALFYKDILNAIGQVSIPGFGVDEKKVKEKIYIEYADPTKNEVYFPGNNNIKLYAKAAGVDLHSSPITEKDFVAVVYTDQVIKIQQHTDDPKEVWNNIYYNRIYPLQVYVDGELYVVYCKCDIREYDWHVTSMVCWGFPPKCYDLNKEYKHMPKEDALVLLNNPPFA